MNMNIKLGPIPAVKFSHCGKTTLSLYPSKDTKKIEPVTYVYFNTCYGILVYYNSEEKKRTLIGLDVHNKIEAAAKGENDGWFTGFSIKVNEKGTDYYLAASKDISVISKEDVEKLGLNG